MCALAAAMMLAACGSTPPPPKQATPAAPKPETPAIPPEVQAAAEASLGSEVIVLAHGDLSLSGAQQVLAANLLKTTPTGMAPGTLFTRLVVLTHEGGKWREVLRCDEHLKNEKGYLGATPLAGVQGWRLQHEQDKTKGLVMYFTPLYQPKSGNIPPIGVRWNPRVKRYQSLNRSFENFLGEVTTLENPERYLR